MATTAAEYLASLGTLRHTSTLPIAAHRGWSFNEYDQDTPDPHNNIGRMCDIAQRYDFNNERAGRTWQIIRYVGCDDRFNDEGRNESVYLVVHVDDPGSYGQCVPSSALTNLY